MNYSLYENDQLLFASQMFDEVIHELLSLVNSRINFLVKNGLMKSSNKLDFTDLYIETTVTSNPYKRYKSVYEKWIYHPETNSMVDMIGNGVYRPMTDKALASLFNEISSKVNSSSTGALENKTTQNKVIVDKKVKDVISKNNESIVDALKDTVKLMNNVSKDLNLEPLIATRKKQVSDSDNNSVMFKDSDSESDSNSNSGSENNEDNEDNEDVSSRIEKLLADQIKKLQEIKDEKEKEILELKEVHNEQKEALTDYVCDLRADQMKMRLAKEKEDEHRRIFKSQKDFTYPRIKADFESGSINESHPFMHEYTIYKFMDDNKLLDAEDNYEVYQELKHKMFPPEENNTDEVVEVNDEEYLPHNYNYLSEEEKQKYRTAVGNNKTLIDKFVEQQNKKQVEETSKPKHRSLEEILAELGPDEEVKEVVDEKCTKSECECDCDCNCENYKCTGNCECNDKKSECESEHELDDVRFD
jgi:hypothetical protein